MDTTAQKARRPSEGARLQLLGVQLIQNISVGFDSVIYNVN
jgi:hypothetical protein